jgi:DNA ligase (NAD+)
MDRIDELKARISKAREEYFNLAPSISDQEFDAMVDELKRLEPEALEVSAVGAPPPKHSVWEKVRHEIPMGSLDKANSLEEMEAWRKKCTSTMEGEGATTWFVTHKIDGSSMELVYRKGELIRCVTRGDGVIGEDVTENVRKIPSQPT